MSEPIQMMLPYHLLWSRTSKGDNTCRILADKHYSRQTPGHPQFCRPGRNLVLRLPKGDAVWVTWDGIRDDDWDAWECTLFRNESDFQSSELIREAVKVTLKEWGTPPGDGFITYIDRKKVASPNPGYCFKCAGWKSAGKSKSGKLCLQFNGGKQ